MQLDLPSGTVWEIRDASKKLAHRAALPGARVFDLGAQALRDARQRGVSSSDRLVLALPASWLVNSPAISRVLRRWALPPQHATFLALLESLEEGPVAWMAGAVDRESVAAAVASLGDEPYLAEAVSKVLALLVPEMVPLMPAPARAFVLGSEEPAAGADAFVRMIDWFAETTVAHDVELAEMASGQTEVNLMGPGVLDRLLWFDSEGHRHFPPP